MIKDMLRGAAAVIGGFVAVAVSSVATDAILESLKIFPGQAHPEAYASWMLALALAYRSAYAVVGGYVAARLASRRPMLHVTWLAVIGGIGGVAGAIAGWGLGNHWYPVLLAATGPAFVWLGGRLFMRKPSPS